MPRDAAIASAYLAGGGTPENMRPVDDDTRDDFVPVWERNINWTPGE